MSASDAASYASHWLAIALGDLAVATAIVEAPDLPTRTAAELAQQAAEKALKAVIALDGVEPPRTHDLVRLRDLIPEHVGVRELEVDLRALSDAYPAARYPDLDEPPLAPAATRRLVHDAVELVQAVMKYLARSGVDVAGVEPS
jgi:HEPN domain-containing protein